MRNFLVVLVFLSALTAGFSTTLDSVLVATFGGGVCRDDTFFQLAMFFEPQFMRRGWFKYSGTSVAFFDTCEWAAESAAVRGIIFEGGVQAANINPNFGGWLWASPEDSEPPFVIPSEIVADFATRNADGTFYYVNNIFGNSLFHSAIGNENWISYCLWWAYRQVERGARSIEFDEVDGAYSYAFLEGDVPDTANPNDGYDDYALGTANFCRCPGVIFFADLDSAPQVVYASARGTGTTPELAIDGDFSTLWSSFQPDGQTLTVDLGRSRRICQIYLAFGDVVPREFSVQFWDGAHWQDFSPPAADTENSQRVRSFLVEQQWAETIRFITPDSAEITELQLFGDGFRQYLLRRFCGDSGWTATDPRWESQMLVPLDDTTVCPDGTMNSFDYRAYLRYHGWNNNPFGGTPSGGNMFEPPNPFFYLWFPHRFLAEIRRATAAYPETLSYFWSLYEQSFDGRRRREFWKTLVDSLRAFEDSLGENLILTHNGSAQHPLEGVDYLILSISSVPGKHYPSETDSQRIILDARYTILNAAREIISSAREELGENLPVIAFFDFGHSGFPFYHIGGKDAPADQRAQYMLTYLSELYAAGSKFAIPLTGNENYYIWLDSLSDGTCLGEKIKPLCDFIQENGWLYLGEWEISPRENQVRVNGVEVYNGDSLIPTVVNESGVAAALLRSPDSSVFALHIINHNWDTTALEMVPQESLDITVPVDGICDTVFALAPDAEPITLPFSQSGDAVHIVLPHLENYAVAVFHISPGSEVANPEEHRPGQVKVLSSRDGKLLIETRERAKLYLYNISGHIVLSKNLSAGRTQIVLPDDLSSGIYILRISTDKVTRIEKVLLLN